MAVAIATGPAVSLSVLPTRCALCAGDSAGHFLCAPCVRALPWHVGGCPRCGLWHAGEGECGRCQRSPPPWSCLVSAWDYVDPVRGLVMAFKYGGRRGWAPALAAMLALAVRNQARGASVDALVPVPMHWRREVYRGANHAEHLARALQAELADALTGSRAARPPALMPARRARLGPRLAALNRADRARALKADDFEVDDAVAGLRVAVVDDVLTTGTTARAVALAARKAGAVEVAVWCLARAHAPGD